jgi:hypothetical protein
MENPLGEMRLVLSGLSDFSYGGTDLSVFLYRTEGLVNLLLAICQTA